MKCDRNLMFKPVEAPAETLLSETLLHLSDLTFKDGSLYSIVACDDSNPLV